MKVNSKRIQNTIELYIVLMDDSHCPEELNDIKDIEVGCNILLDVVYKLAQMLNMKYNYLEKIKGI